MCRDPRAASGPSGGSMAGGHKKWTRIARWTALISTASLVGLWVLYALTANLIIGTGLLEHVASDGEQVLLRYDSAWCWWPGRVTVKGFSLGVQDSNIQFQLTLDRATLHVDLPALARRTFAASHVQAEGVSFHFRHKLMRLKGNEVRAAAYPRIPGFADPPLKDPWLNPPLTDADYNLWTVELTDVHAAARDLWFMEWRILGPATVDGAFRLKPVRTLRIDPTILRLADCAFSTGGNDVLHAAHGAIEVDVGTYDVRSRVGLDVLQQINATVNLDGEVVSVAPVVALYVNDKSMEMTDGEGKLAVHLAMQDGRVLPQSQLEYTSHNLAAQTSQGRIHGELRALIRELEGRLLFGLFIAAADLVRDGVEVVRMRGLAAGVDLSGLDLWRPFQVTSGSFSLAMTTVKNIHAVQGLMPHSVVLHGGSAELSGHGDITEDAVTLHAEMTLEQAHVGIGKLDATGSGEASLFLKPNADLHGARGELQAALHDTSVQIGSGHANGIWFKVRATGQFWPFFDTSVTLRTGPEDAIRRLALGNAFLPKVVMAVFGGETVRAKGRVRAGKGRVSVVVASAKDADIEASGAYRSAKGQAGQGKFIVHLGPFQLAVTIHDGEVSVGLVSKSESSKPKAARHK